jgi:hypothetical protein
MPIDGIVYRNDGSSNPHSHRQIEGYCENIPAGHITVGFSIGACEKLPQYDGYTGYRSVSRIMIKEVPPPQS